MFLSLAADAPEYRPGFAPRAGVSHVLFDFDGTLSWLRHGWPAIMAGLFLEHHPIRSGESPAVLHQELLEELLSLNGKPSIFQMERFAERLRARGETPPSPADLLAEYSRRLDEQIRERSARVTAGTAARDEYVIHGARQLLDQLRDAGCKLMILSGTREERVREEAALLGLADYFGGHIYGSPAEPSRFTKRAVMDRLLAEEGITGAQLLSFGDGPVEIEQTKALGGLAVAVASHEEANGGGRMDAAKRRQLLAAGADVVIADYRDPETLLAALLRSA